MTLIRLGLVALALATLAACGRSDSRPATQVAAKVNGDEISVHQINNSLARLGAVGAAQAKQATGVILERLIDQQLLIQKATEGKLDRDAVIMTAIENARRQILSQAYLERAVAVAEKPTPEEIRKYYAEHPELFAQRRIYRFQELLAVVNEEQMKAVRSRAEKGRNLNQLVEWMRSQGIAYNGSFSIRAAEQLPMDQLPRLQAMKPGELTVVPAAPGRVAVIQLAAVQDAPLSEKEATPAIERFLLNRKRGDIAADEMKRLRAAAKVEYVGDFGKLAGAAPAAASLAEPPAKQEAKEDKSFIDKGLTGLK